MTDHPKTPPDGEGRRAEYIEVRLEMPEWMREHLAYLDRLEAESWTRFEEARAKAAIKPPSTAELVQERIRNMEARYGWMPPQRKRPILMKPPEDPS